jgi:hypothetical protein
VYASDELRLTSDVHKDKKDDVALEESPEVEDWLMYLRSILRSVRDETSKPVEIEKLELADEDKELFMRAWACHDAKQEEENVVLAFDYFMILEMVASQYRDMALVSKLSTEEKQQIGLFYNLWRQRQAKSGGLISEQEASSFNCSSQVSRL